MGIEGVACRGSSSFTSAARRSHENDDVTPTWCRVPRVVVQAQQQRADVRRPARLVPAEAGDHAISSAGVLDLEHGALARLVRRVEGLGDDAVEAGTFEALEPIARHAWSCVAGVR